MTRLSWKYLASSGQQWDRKSYWIMGGGAGGMFNLEVDVQAGDDWYQCK